MAVEVGERAGLAEMLHDQGANAVAMHRAEPGERRPVAVEDGDEAAMAGHLRQETLGATGPHIIGRQPMCRLAGSWEKQ